ncbi:DUF3298 domain-containing protein [Paenibacillus lemnae]|uniref:DUF3298 domain-containing protein n=2 Tax=Paenibacillus lemnae TaxID=1330551 RepID=A0A848M0B6_PAELE|nr:DUF3298 domain-containing protein [Paenibacillus lemnae]
MIYSWRYTVNTDPISRITIIHLGGEPGTERIWESDQAIHFQHYDKNTHTWVTELTREKTMPVDMVTGFWNAIMNNVVVLYTITGGGGLYYSVFGRVNGKLLELLKVDGIASGDIWLEQGRLLVKECSKYGEWIRQGEHFVMIPYLLPSVPGALRIEYAIDDYGQVRIKSKQFVVPVGTVVQIVRTDWGAPCDQIRIRSEQHVDNLVAFIQRRAAAMMIKPGTVEIDIVPGFDWNHAVTVRIEAITVRRIRPGKTKVISAQLRRPLLTVELPQVELIHKHMSGKINSLILSIIIRLMGQAVSSSSYIVKGSYSVPYNNHDLLSLVLTLDIYASGSAHSQTVQDSLFLNTKTGQIYDLSELFAKGVSYEAVLNRFLLAANGPFSNPPPSNHRRYYITNHDLVLYYPMGLYSPEAAGIPEVRIPLDKLLSVLSPDSPLYQMMKSEQGDSNERSLEQQLATSRDDYTVKEQLEEVKSALHALAMENWEIKHQIETGKKKEQARFNGLLKEGKYVFSGVSWEGPEDAWRHLTVGKYYDYEIKESSIPYPLPPSFTAKDYANQLIITGDRNHTVTFYSS